MNENNHAKLDQIKTGIKNFRWLKFIFIVLLPPLIFSWPLLPNNKPFPFKAFLELSISGPSTTLTESDKPKEFPLEGTSKSMGSKDLLSSLFKVKIGPMPTELCFNNQNKIFDGSKEINPLILVDSDEAGAMSFKYRRLDNNVLDEIYLKLGASNCRDLPAEGIVLVSNGVVVRNPLPIGIKASQQKDGIFIKLEPKSSLRVEVNKEPGYQRIKWQTHIFLKNFTLLFFAWVVFLSSITAIITRFKKYSYLN